MQLRSILATLLAFFLLSISCVANACATSCDLKALGHGCHDASSASAPASMTGMHDSEMNMSKNPAQVQANEQCKHSVCEQEPQAVVSDRTLLHAQSLATLHAFVTVLVFPTDPLNVGIESVNRAPLRVAFQTTLRV